jgi:Holliday junction resolvase
MKGRSAKAKGKLLEDHVAKEIRERGIDPRAARDGASGASNREKADVGAVILFDEGQRSIGIECKNYAKAHVQDWWRQAEKLCDVGYTDPVVVYKLKGEKYTDAKAIVRLDTLLDLIVLAGDPRESEYTSKDNNKLKWALRALKEAINKVIKLLD